MKEINPFGFHIPSTLPKELQSQIEVEYMLHPIHNYQWDLPLDVFEEKNIFGHDHSQDYPIFNFAAQERDQQLHPFKTNDNQNLQNSSPQPYASNLAEVHPEVGVRLVDENEAEAQLENVEDHILNSTGKSENSSHRKLSTDNCDSLSDSKSSESEKITIKISGGIFKIEENAASTPNTISPTKEPKIEPKIVEIEKQKPEKDPDFYYKIPRKTKFEYNKRKDVILKTILRKCRRVLQEDFNKLTGYFANRKMQGHQFLKDCIQKYHDSLPNKPSHLDLLFYLGAILYPQEMGRGVDCFVDCAKEDRVRQRKFLRAKIQKVHDVLYRYSHEKMDYFVNVPELSYLFIIFYKKQLENNDEDQYYMNGATEIFDKCKATLSITGIIV